MTIELPDGSATDQMTADELRLELACALFARRKISIVAGARLAGVDFFAFQRALGDRRIEIITGQHLEADMESLKTLFPS